MILSGKTTFWCAIAFCIACLPSGTQVSAKNTPDPTPRPTPVPTALPSKFPSFSPTATPTASPSKIPSDSPTERLMPSEAPTVTPTASPSKTYTEAPTVTPTASPSKTHTDSPTEISTSTVRNDHFIYSDGVVYSLLPEIAFHVFIAEEYVSTEKIQSLFDDFLSGVLEEISNSYGLDYSHVDSDGEILTSSQILLAGTDYRIKMDGFVYFFDKAPTSESLKQSLNVYFSFWGLSELQDYLTRAGIDKADVLSISVGDENVSFVSNSVQNESQGERNSGSAIRNFFFWEGELSKTNIVMVYTGFVIVTVVIALLVCRYRVRRRRIKQEKDQQSQEGDSTKTSHDDEDEERGPSSSKILVSKAPSRIKSSRDKSSSFQGVDASKKLPMIREKETERGNAAGIPDSTTIGKTVKQSTCKETEKKRVDRKKKIPNSKKKKLMQKGTKGNAVGGAMPADDPTPIGKTAVKQSTCKESEEKRVDKERVREGRLQEI